MSKSRLITIAGLTAFGLFRRGSKNEDSTSLPGFEDARGIVIEADGDKKFPSEVVFLEEFEYFYDNYKRLSMLDKIPVFRCIAVEDESQIRTGAELGPFWSFSEASAENFCDGNVYSGKPHYMISGFVKPEDVDWRASIEVGAFCSFGFGEIEAENELHIPHPERIEDIQIRLYRLNR